VKKPELPCTVKVTGFAVGARLTQAGEFALSPLRRRNVRSSSVRSAEMLTGAHFAMMFVTPRSVVGDVMSPK